MTIKQQAEARMFKKLTEAISALAGELSETRQQKTIEFEWLKSHAGLATKQDLAAAKAEIIKAIGTRIDPARLKKLTAQLSDSSQPLAAAVAENTPTLSD